MYACTATCESWPRKRVDGGLLLGDLLLGVGDLGVELVFSSSAVPSSSRRAMSALALERLELVGDLGDERLLVADRVGGGGVGRTTGSIGHGQRHDDSPPHPDVAAVHDGARV